jgi:hypothetical protein
MLAELGDRLSAHDIVVSRLLCDWGSFGSWELQVERGSEADRYRDAARLDPGHTVPPDMLRCTWDGRDHYLMIEVSPRRPLSAANEWRREHAKGFDTSDEAVQYLETYLQQRFQHDPHTKA